MRVAGADASSVGPTYDVVLSPGLLWGRVDVPDGPDDVSDRGVRFGAVL